MAVRRPGPSQPPLAGRNPSSSLARGPAGRSMSSSVSSSRASSDNDRGSAGPSSPKRGTAVPGRLSAPPKRVVPASAHGNAGAGDEESNIKVAVRVRGRAPGEAAPANPILSTSGPRCSQVHIQLEAAPVSSVATIPSSSSLVNQTEAAREKTYSFDNVFGPEADQGMVYQTVVMPVLQEVMSGYNCTIFAYGQTGTGKTHTMEGDLTSQLGTYSSEAGIIPRTLYRLFHQLELSNNEFSVHASFVELYNEELRDLLSAEQPAPLTSGGLKVYDDKGRGVVIQGLEDTPMKDAAHGLELLRKGSQKRQIAATRCNENSSRSHSVFTLTVHTKETTSKGEDVLRVGKLNLVDLAGSENIGRSGAENKRAREAGMINQSLLTLGRVINALVEKSSHVPYRESKLTRLLQESLGGRTKTCIIATVSADKSNLEETISTLDYALRAKSIRNRPEMNSRMTRAGLIMEYVKEIERLKRDVLAARDKEGFWLSNESWKEMKDEGEARKTAADDLRRLVEVAESKRESLQEQFEQNMQLLVKRDSETKAVKAECAVKKRELDGVIEQAKNLETALTEETELREAYRNSEKKLNRIALGLRSQAEESQSDLGALFEKLARKTQVETTNQRIVSDFQQTVKSMTKQLEKRAREFHSTHDTFTADLSSKMQVFGQEEQAALASCRDQVDGRLSQLQERAASLSEQHDISFKNVGEFATAIEGARAAMASSLEEHSQNLSSDWKMLEQQMTQSHSSSMSNVKKSLHSMAELIGTLVKQTQAYVAEQTEKVADAQRYAEEASQREIDTLKEQNSLLTTLLEEERSKSTSMREELARKIGDLLVGYTSERDRSLTEAVSSVQTRMTASESNAHAFLQVHNEKMSSMTEAAESHRGFVEEKEKVARKYRKRGEAAIEEADGSVVQGLAAGADRIDQGSSSMREANDSAGEAMSAASVRAREQADSARLQQRELLEGLTEDGQSSQQATMQQLDSTLSHVGRMSDEAASLLAEHCNVGLNFLGDASTQLAQMRSQTQSYLEDHYARDLPTGATPQKKEVDAAAMQQQQWKLVPNVRQRALEQYRHLVAKKQQAAAAVAAAKSAPRLSTASVGTLPDDSRATVDVDGEWVADDGEVRSDDGEDAERIVPGEDDQVQHDDDEEEELEDSLGDIAIGSSGDETIQLSAGRRPSRGGVHAVDDQQQQQAQQQQQQQQPQQQRRGPGQHQQQRVGKTQRSVLAEKNVDGNVVPSSADGGAAGGAPLKKVGATAMNVEAAAATGATAMKKSSGVGAANRRAAATRAA